MNRFFRILTFPWCWVFYRRTWRLVGSGWNDPDGQQQIYRHLRCTRCRCDRKLLHYETLPAQMFYFSNVSDPTNFDYEPKPE